MLPIAPTSQDQLEQGMNNVSLSQENPETSRGNGSESTGTGSSSPSSNYYLDVNELDQSSSIMPSFLELDDTPLDKIASETQQLELKQLACDTNDEACTIKLLGGLRPGDFMACFEKLSWVKKVQAQPDCAAFLTSLGKWMSRMAEADRCQTLLPESVRIIRK